MTTASPQMHEPLFGIVFAGQFLPGRDPTETRTLFAERFGAEAAAQVFEQERAVLKRDVSQAEAAKMQTVLAAIGMAVEIAPVAAGDAAGDVAASDGAQPLKPQREKRRGPAAMIVRAGERSRARGVAPPTRAAATADQAPPPQSTQPLPEDDASPEGDRPSDPSAGTTPRRAARPASRWLAVALALGCVAALAGLVWFGLKWL